ncbi:hypothetical protein ACFOEY_03635 [Paracandidimonas soli]
MPAFSFRHCFPACRCGAGGVVRLWRTITVHCPVVDAHPGAPSCVA